MSHQRHVLRPPFRERLVDPVPGKVRQGDAGDAGPGGDLERGRGHVRHDRAGTDGTQPVRFGCQPVVFVGHQLSVPLERGPSVDVQAVRLDHTGVDRTRLDLDARREDPGGSGRPRDDPQVRAGREQGPTEDGAAHGVAESVTAGVERDRGRRGGHAGL